MVARAQLAELPEFSGNDDSRTHKAAQARTIGSEDDGHVPGEIDGAHGIGVVVDIRGMQAGFAAILARTLRLRSDEANAGAVGVVMDFPGGGEEGVDAGLREEIGRAVGAIKDTDLPR